MPPAGFTTQHATYDSVKITGYATADSNFNRSPEGEGTGIDTVLYIIPNIPIDGNYRVEAKLLYQTAPPRFAADLFQYNTPEVNRFRQYYQSADKNPVVIDSLQASVLPTGIAPVTSKTLMQSPLLVRAYPNPFNPVVNLDIQLNASGRLSVEIFDITGRRVRRLHNLPIAAGHHVLQWNGQDDRGEPVSSGFYILKIVWSGKTTPVMHIQKVFLLR